MGSLVKAHRRYVTYQAVENHRNALMLIDGVSETTESLSIESIRRIREEWSKKVEFLNTVIRCRRLNLPLPELPASATPRRYTRKKASRLDDVRQTASQIFTA